MANDLGNSRKLIWFMGLFMVIVGALTTVNLILLLDSRQQEQAEAEQEKQIPLPIFVQVGPMTVNLRSDAYGHRYLYAGLSLRVRDEESREQILTHMPEVHSRLLLLLSSQTASSLEQPDGKKNLATEIVALFDTPLAKGWPRPKVDAALFTDFIVQ